MWSVSGPQHRHIASVGGLFPEATSQFAPGRVAYIFGGLQWRRDIQYFTSNRFVSWTVSNELWYPRKRSLMGWIFESLCRSVSRACKTHFSCAVIYVLQSYASLNIAVIQCYQLVLWGWHPLPPCVLRTALFWPCVLRTALFWHCVLRTV